MLEKRDVHKIIAEQISNNDVVLYMKGTPQFPLCGFSGVAVKLLHGCGVKDFLAINVLDDPEIREGIKAFSDWPTIPQLYVHGEFIGGCDIMREMAKSGALADLFTVKEEK